MVVAAVYCSYLLWLFIPRRLQLLRKLTPFLSSQNCPMRWERPLSLPLSHGLLKAPSARRALLPVTKPFPSSQITRSAIPRRDPGRLCRASSADLRDLGEMVVALPGDNRSPPLCLGAVISSRPPVFPPAVVLTRSLIASISCSLPLIVELLEKGLPCGVLWCRWRGGGAGGEVVVPVEKWWCRWRSGGAGGEGVVPVERGWCRWRGGDAGGEVVVPVGIRWQKCP